MEPQKLEANEVIFKAGDNYVDFIVVFDGMLELYTEMDNGTEFIIEHLYTGSVINAH